MKKCFTCQRVTLMTLYYANLYSDMKSSYLIMKTFAVISRRWSLCLEEYLLKKAWQVQRALILFPVTALNLFLNDHSFIDLTAFVRKTSRFWITVPTRGSKLVSLQKTYVVMTWNWQVHVIWFLRGIF